MDNTVNLELKLSVQMKDAIKLIQDILENSSELLLELPGKKLLQIVEGGKFITGDLVDLPTVNAGARVELLNFSDEFMGCVSALGTLYRQRGFVVPASFDERHN